MRQVSCELSYIRILYFTFNFRVKAYRWPVVDYTPLPTSLLIAQAFSLYSADSSDRQDRRTRTKPQMQLKTDDHSAWLTSHAVCVRQTTVTHPSTNRTRCRVTSLLRRTTLPPHATPDPRWVMADHRAINTQARQIYKINRE